MLNRRKFLVTGVGLAATAPLFMCEARGADAAISNTQSGRDKMSARAYGATKADAPLGQLQIQRRAVGPHDVLIDILYSVFATPTSTKCAMNGLSGVQLSIRAFRAMRSSVACRPWEVP